MFSAIGARVSYPNCISGKVCSLIMKYFLLFPYSDVRSYTCQEFSEKDCDETREFARSVNFDNTRNIVYGMLEVIAMEKY